MTTTNPTLLQPIQKTTRIESIDLLRGLVMVIMALDHVRDYFHLGAFVNDPTNLEITTPILFFTRFITHYCAPIFVFLTGTSAFLYGLQRTKKELSRFLVTRGLWLIFIEIVVMNFLWWFDVSYDFINLQVIWAIGWCMIFLSGLVYLRTKAILGLGLLIVFGHNLLDPITTQGNDLPSLLWYAIHQQQFVSFGEHTVAFYYPILAWAGVIMLGYCFGHLYRKDFDAQLRKKYLLRLGLGAIALFFILRSLNIYGDLVPWATQRDGVYTLLSFFNVTKYPPSLAYLLITLGPGLVFLYAMENTKNALTDFFLVYGRVPFFYYIIHVLLIHLLAMLGLWITNGNWRNMILQTDALTTDKMANYGYPLWAVYVVWMGVVLLLYPFCKKYMAYKANNKGKWWLAYL